MEFKECKLNDICILISKGSTPRGKLKYSLTDKIGFLRVTDLNDFDRIKKSEYTLKEIEAKEYKMKLWPIDTVLVSIEGTIGKVSILEKEMTFNQAIAGIICDKTKISPLFLMYYLKAFKIFEKMIKGTIMPALRLGDISNLEIKLTSLENQNKIVKILSSIDRKIELNNLMNENLHNVMEIKFKNWTNSMNGYQVSNLSNIATYTNGLAMQNFRPVNEEGLPVVKIKEMNNGITSETERCKSNIKENVKINNGDVLFAWSGTLCMNIWCGGLAGLNQHIFKITSDAYPKWFYYFWTFNYLDYFIEIAKGKTTTMGHIKRDELELSKVLIPNEEDLKRMNKMMEPLFNKYANNKIENQTLIQIRGILLPKLMNGEIDLDNTEI